MDELSNKINQEIKKSAIYNDYVKLKKTIENDSYLADIKKRLQELKNEVCRTKDNSLINEYYELEKEYKSNSLVKDYLAVKDELNCLLKDIANILSVN